MSAKVIPNIVVIRFQICIFDILNTAQGVHSLKTNKL